MSAPAMKRRTSLKAVGKPHGNRRASDHFEILFENAGDALMVVDLEKGSILNVNRQMEELAGVLKVDLVNRDVSLLTPTESHDRSKPFSLNLLKNSGFFEDTVLKGIDGRLRFASLSVNTMLIGGREVAMCIIRDVSEKKAMERELITKHTELRNAYVSLEKANEELKAMQETLVQSGKLAALGELAAGIAHELNQPLTAIKGFAQEALAIVREPAQVESAADYIKEVVQAAQKMDKIISHLRNFTRKSTEDYRWVSVHDVIDESLLMLDRQLKARGIAVERRFAKDLPKVYCNPFQLEQVFINLATNARDAIEAKGEKQGRIIVNTEVGQGNMVQIRYEDNGCGINDSIKTKIFNPFFTTKEVGKGMGLGLSITYGILSKLSASIFVESQVGKGTAFTVKLPVDYRNL